MSSSSLVIQEGSKSNHKGFHTAQTEDNVKTAVKTGVNVARGKSVSSHQKLEKARSSLPDQGLCRGSTCVNTLHSDIMVCKMSEFMYHYQHTDVHISKCSNSRQLLKDVALRLSHFELKGAPSSCTLALGHGSSTARLLFCYHAYLWPVISHFSKEPRLSL